MVKKIIGEIDLSDFRSFLAWTFLNFLAHCVFQTNNAIFRQNKIDLLFVIFRNELEGLNQAATEKEQEADTMSKMIAKLEKSIAR